MNNRDESFVLPYEPLSSEEKVKFEKIMCAGNVPLRRWHEVVRKRLRNKRFTTGRIAFLEKKLRTEQQIRPEWQKELETLTCPSKFYSRTKFRCDLFGKMGKSVRSVVVWGVKIPCNDMRKIWEVKQIETKLILGFSRMITKIVNQWVGPSNDVSIETEDLYNEGVFATIRASFCFTRKDIRFCTYVYHAIRRRIMTVCMQTQPLSAFPQAAVDLHREYKAIQQKANGYITHDEIVKQMGLSNKHRAVLESMLVSVVNQAALDYSEYSEMRDESHNHDFSQIGTVFAGMDGRKEWFVGGHRAQIGPAFVHRTETDLDIQKAVEQIKSKASELEIAVLNGFLENPNNGWMTQVANSLTNPQTGSSYSRMSITYAWRRVREMFLDALGVDNESFRIRLEAERQDRGDKRKELACCREQLSRRKKPRKKKAA
jgi:hypothetical protein